MEYTQKVVYQSNYWYNDGLKKAKIRDMTGAVTSLKKSLQFNSENIAARNLLGLVYYGRGEVGEALVEWILSKNCQLLYTEDTEKSGGSGYDQPGDP